MALTTNPVYRFCAKEYHRLITTYEFNDVSDALKYVDAYFVINQRTSLPSFVNVLTWYGNSSVGYYRVPFTTYIHRHFEFLCAQRLVRQLEGYRRRSQNYTAILREIKAKRPLRGRIYPSYIRWLSSQPIMDYTQREENLRQFRNNHSFITSGGLLCIVTYGLTDNYLDNLEGFKNNEEKLSMKRIKGRTRIIKEELAMTACHPDRIEQLITKYGLDVLDNL
jgi:hypothetical protein